LLDGIIALGQVANQLKTILGSDGQQHE
jgi:hypothetical protein